jgi:hypothetical protein
MDTMINLADIVKERPFPEFAQWWEMGENFIGFMSRAIVPQWRELVGPEGDLDRVQGYAAKYLELVYERKTDPALVRTFLRRDASRPIASGEFDALSYAFYRSAFESLGGKYAGDEVALAKGKRAFAIRVGKIFFTAIHDHLQLNLPTGLETPAQYARLQGNIDVVAEFLLEEGYLRDQCTFTFSVDAARGGVRIQQEPGDFLDNLHQKGVGYALYIMGYPAILPSAVYLYRMYGEAQHHSSRTIEELFDRVGYQARETDDFNPSEFPSDRVVELWLVRPS